MIMKPKYATQRELRQIADRLEAVCVQSRLRVENIAVACPLCKTAAEELRELARGWSDAPAPASENGRARRVEKAGAASAP